MSGATQTPVQTLATRSPVQPQPACKVAYIMSRFPKITETFVLYEMLAIEEQGLQVGIYPLLRERTNVMHPEAVPMVKRAHFQPFFSWPILCAHLYFLFGSPLKYLGTLWSLLWENLGSYRFFVGALGLFPKAVFFARHMREHGVSHVHAHFASHPAAAAYVIHRLVGIPYSFTAHGSDLHRDRHMLREKVSKAAFVAAISEYNRNLILEECGQQFADKVTVIHCGVDTSVFQPRPDHSSASETATGEDAAGDRFNILCIGTLHEVKGHAYLIEACRQLAERAIAYDCHLVGDGPDEEALREQAEQAGIADRVHFHGRRSRDEVARFIAQADVAATPSVPTSDGRREGIPVVLMEAMGSGVPVVASRLSGIPELVIDQETGLLVPPRDATALADALAALQADIPLRRRLAAAGRDKVVREFDLTSNARLLSERFAAEGQP